MNSGTVATADSHTGPRPRVSLLPILASIPVMQHQEDLFPKQCPLRGLLKLELACYLLWPFPFPGSD